MRISVDGERRRRGAALGLAVLVFAALVLAGCGGSGSSSSSSSSTASTEGTESTESTESGGKAEGAEGSGTEVGASEASEAGVKAGEESGEPLAVEKQVIGEIQVVGAADSVQRATHGLEAAAAKLGWEVKVCDGEGDPVKMSNCANTLLSEGVTAIVGHSIEAAVAKPQLEEAKKRGIPWINIGGPGKPTPLYSTEVVENEEEIGTTMGQYIAERLEGKGTVAATEEPAIYALKLRMEAVYNALAENPEIEIIDKHTVDLTNLVPDVRTWSESVLTKEPSLGAFALCVDTDPVAVASVVQSNKGPGKQFPERPLIVGSLGDLANLELIRKGEVDATADVPYEAFGWITVDQLAGYFSREAEFAKHPEEAYGLPIIKAQLVTKENVPANPKEYPAPPVDFEAFFGSKWETEFTNG
jgi:ABC-type sugar transport system substrate-binding protein